MDNSRLNEPVIGLALGSGAARGWAHIGVLHALLDMGIVPTIVAGTSIGSLVGAAYASDQLDALEDWVRPMTWKDTLGYMDVSVWRGGLVQGDKLLDAIHQQAIQDVLIEAMPLRFGAVATQMETGQEIWFQDGSLLDAVRASISLPGLFSPVKQKGHWLMDGALVNPVPVSLCRAMGADIVIAVNLNRDLLHRHSQNGKENQSEEGVNYSDTLWNRVSGQLRTALNDGKDTLLSKIYGQETDVPGLFEVLSSSIAIMQDRITRSRMAGDPPEITLSPCVGSIGIMDFHKAKIAIREGEECVNRMRPVLEQLVCEA